MKKVLKMFSIGLLAGMAQLTPVLASGDQCTAVVPIEIENAAGATVTVTSESRDALDSVLETVIKVDDKGKGEMIVTADEPATYEYTLAEAAGDKKGVTYDSSTYEAKVFFETEGVEELKPHVIVWKTGSSTKEDAVRFINADPAPSKENAYSGTEGVDMLPPVTALVAGIGLIVYSMKHRQERLK